MLVRWSAREFREHGLAATATYSDDGGNNFRPPAELPNDLRHALVWEKGEVYPLEPKGESAPKIGRRAPAASAVAVAAAVAAAAAPADGAGA